MGVRKSLDGRINNDLKIGDYGLALQRARSHLASKGYDADLLARAGQIAFEMHDLRQAGSLWLTSSAKGENVTRAIDFFLGTRFRDPRNALSRLSPAGRLARLEEYHPVARERIERLCLQESIIWEGRGRIEHKPMGRIASAALKIVLAIVGFVTPVCLLLGINALYDLVFR